MSAHSAGAYTATLLVNVIRGGGRAPPTLTSQGQFYPHHWMYARKQRLQLCVLCGCYSRYLRVSRCTYFFWMPVQKTRSCPCYSTVGSLDRKQGAVNISFGFLYRKQGAVHVTVLLGSWTENKELYIFLLDAWTENKELSILLLGAWTENKELYIVYKKCTVHISVGRLDRKQGTVDTYI